MTLIPAIPGKVTRDGKVCEPDIQWILEKWLNRHPEITKRQNEIRILRGRWTTADGLKTEVITVSIVNARSILPGTTPNRMPTSTSIGKLRSGTGRILRRA